MLAVTQIGDKKDRTYRVTLYIVNSPSKFFTVQGIDKDFLIFDNDKQLASFKTLTKCKDYIKTVAA
jgi:hypothetical protein